uniref:Ferrochelatase n=1 Tax=Hemiselmis tepida TaxID=464990 RepID=A0A7S0YGK9_9CRYP|mmetsp:Transcript_1180/g.3011  ORF Transcript_1180/g.3011 Transcript_1180/m.3011 type:complete len:404 (+) Transcript_1180:71-1282(+)
MMCARRLWQGQAAVRAALAAAAPRAHVSGARCLSASTKPPTAVVMMNMGGPSTQEEVHPFLHRLFTDRQIMQMPMQDYLGAFIAYRRSPKIREQYAEIGGGSPIRKWTEEQGKMMVEYLDKHNPETAPHKAYLSFRYASPLTEEAVAEMKADGVTRAIAFSQFPQWSCTTSGSSMNEMWRVLAEQGITNDIKWSLIDRWHSHPAFISALAGRVVEGIEQFDEADRHRVVFLFSAHSLPMRRVNAGDPYPQEVGATVGRVMEKLKDMGYNNRYALCWQSKVGPLPWLGPKTQEAMAALRKQGLTHFMAIPVAFTTDHVETLYEIDVEFGEEAAEMGAVFKRSPSFNADEAFGAALGQIASEHIKSGTLCSDQYSLNCAGCVSPDKCRQIANPISPYARMKDMAA